MTYFGKAELSPRWVPTCWEDAASPRNSPPRAPCPQHVVLGSLWICTEPRGRFGGGGGGSCGSQGCLQQGHVQGSQVGAALQGLNSLLAGLCISTFSLPRIKSAAHRLAQTQPGFGCPRELSSTAQLPSGPNCVASPAGPYGAPSLALVNIKSQTGLGGTLKHLTALGRDTSR